MLSSQRGVTTRKHGLAVAPAGLAMAPPGHAAQIATPLGQDLRMWLVL